MKFRFHRGTLEESLATMVEVESIEQLRAVIEKELRLICPTGDEPLSIEPYGYDSRTGTTLRLVTWKYHPIGFIDGSFDEPEPMS